MLFVEPRPKTHFSTFERHAKLAASELSRMHSLKLSRLEPTGLAHPNYDVQDVMLEECINSSQSLGRLMSWKSCCRLSRKSCYKNTLTTRWQTSSSAYSSDHALQASREVGIFYSNFCCILRVTAGRWAGRPSKFDWYSRPGEHLHSLHSIWLRSMSHSVVTEISRLLHRWEQCRCRCTHGRGCGVRWLVLWCCDLRSLNGNYRVRRKQSNVAVRRTAKTSYIAPSSSALLPI